MVDEDEIQDNIQSDHFIMTDNQDSIVQRSARARQKSPRQKSPRVSENFLPKLTDLNIQSEKLLPQVKEFKLRKMSPPALPKLTINTKIGGLKDLTLNRNNSDSNSEMTLQQYRDLISSKETVSTVKGGGNEMGAYELQGRKVLSLSPSRN